MGGEILNQLWGEAEAVPCLCKEIREELQGGGGSLSGGGGGWLRQAGGAGSGDGSGQFLVARRDGGDFQDRTGCAFLARCGVPEARRAG